MRANDAIKEAMEVRGMNQTKLAERMGKSTQSAVGNALANKKGLHSATLVEMAKALGYRVILEDAMNPKNRIEVDE
jgi:transcriptional regulator with XRE-family HTH domain